MPHKPKQPRKSDGEEYRFKIDAYTPATIPMVRLSEYMRELAHMFGEAASVHFKKLARGSTIIVNRVEREAAPKVRERLVLVTKSSAPSDAENAFKALNKLLRDDNAVGKLTGAVIIPFPGRNEVREEFTFIRQQGFVDGIITGVRGRDDTVHIMLQAEDKQISRCYANPSIGKQLAAKFREPVRLFGKGQWSRDSEGNWSHEDFKIESFDPLDDAPLSSALNDLRQIQTEWGDTAYSDIVQLRHGPKGGRNGRH